MATSEENASESDAPAPLTNEQLVSSCVQGSHDAWSALIDRYRNLIFSIPVRQGFSREDASEVFQNVCLKLLEHLPRLREPRTLTAWLITVTLHECSHWRRRQPRFSELETEGSTLSDEASVVIPTEMEEELRREQILREAMLEVGPRCKELVQSLFFSIPAVSYKRLASRLGVAAGSIGFIRMRCLKRLRRLLEEKGF